MPPRTKIFLYNPQCLIVKDNKNNKSFHPKIKSEQMCAHFSSIMLSISLLVKVSRGE